MASTEPSTETRSLIPRADEPLPTGDDKTRSIQAMFDVIAPRYDMVNRIMTFRMDVGWRRRAVAALGLAPGSTVVDLACGTGDLAHDLAARGLEPIGVDLSFGMLAAAPRDFPRLQADGMSLPLPDASVDGVTCGFALRNFTDLRATFAEMARVVRPGGRLALLEVATPPNPVLRFGHGVYFGQVVPRIGAALSDGDAYRYLPRSVAYLPEPDEMLEMLRDLGFTHVRRTLFSVGIAQLLSATRGGRVSEGSHDPEPQPVQSRRVTHAQDLTCTSRAADLDPGDPPAGVQVSAFRSPRRELWGMGEALRIELPAPWPDHVARVSEELAAITSVDEVGAPGSGPVAFGALPFDRRAAATLVVPAVTFGRSAEGARWMTTVGPDGVDLSTTSWLAGEPRTPTEVRVRSAERSEVWERSVADATRRIRDGRLTKVVLARELCVESDVHLDAATLLARLRATHPAALCFAVDGFVGASPELLVSRVDDIVRAHPMAGTTPRTGEPEADQRRAAELLSSAKNRSEHQITIDVVHDTLLPWCSFLDAEPSPSVVPAGPVQHLATVVEGRLSHPPPPVLDLVAALHPTPAVGGWPRDAALELIDELEPADRGRYAGPVGWIDAAGNGAWAVGIRSVQLEGERARLFAGVGVVADSDPAAELEETRAKAQAVLGTLLRL